MTSVAAPAYDAVVVVSFGGPEGPDDVMPFLQNVTHGRGVPAERLEEVAQHYRARGGVSPLNAINRELRSALEVELKARGVSLPVYWGNRNWHPFLRDTLRRMQADGVRHALAFVTSAYASYSGCRQYLEDFTAATDGLTDAPVLHRLRHYFDHPGFVGPFVRAVVAALGELPDETRLGAPLVFTAHSIPAAMAAASGPAGNLYPTQVAAAARLVAEGVERSTGGWHPWSVAYQSRSGAPTQGWLEPDVSDRLHDLAREGHRSVVVAPVGFTADHMEVVHDLDTEAAETARGLGLTYARAGTPNTDAEYVAMVAELVAERVAGAPRRALSPLGPSHDVCPATCCPAPQRRGPRG